LIKKFTLNLPQILNSTFDLYKYFKIISNCTANSPKFPLGDLYMHNTTANNNNNNNNITNVDLSCTYFSNFFNTLLQ